MDPTILYTWELGTIVRKAAADMPDAPSVSIVESDRTCTLRGEGVEFVARLGNEYVEFQYSPVNDARARCFDKWTNAIPKQSEARQEGAAYTFRTPNTMDSIYNAMRAMLHAHNEALALKAPAESMIDNILG